MSELDKKFADRAFRAADRDSGTDLGNLCRLTYCHSSHVSAAISHIWDCMFLLFFGCHANVHLRWEAHVHTRTLWHGRVSMFDILLENCELEHFPGSQKFSSLPLEKRAPACASPRRWLYWRWGVCCLVFVVLLRWGGMGKDRQGERESVSVCVCTICIDVKLLIYRGSPRSRGGRWPTKTPPRDPCKRTCRTPVVHLGAIISRSWWPPESYYIYIYIHFSC